MKTESKTMQPINYQKLFQTSSVASMLVGVDDPDFTILDESVVHARLMNVDPKDVIGKPMIEAFPPQDGQTKDEYLAAVRKVVKTGQSQRIKSYRYDVRDDNGNLDQRHWRVGTSPIKDADGRVIAIHYILEDVTEQKHTENNIRLMSRASRQFSASLDYRKTLNNIANMVVPDVADWCAIELLDETGQLRQVAVAHKDPKKVAWAKQLRQKQGDPDMDAPTGGPNVIRTGKAEFYPVITDEMLQAAVTDPEQLELMRSIGFSSAITVPMRLNDEPIGVLSFISAEGRIHYDETDVKLAQSLANRAALAVYNSTLFKSAKDEIKERRKLQKELEHLNKTLEDRVKQRTRLLEATNRGLEEEVSRRRRAESSLAEYGQELERSNQELQDFAYVASHDLQEPLRKIQAFGNLLEAEYKDQLGEGKDYLDRMRGAAARMSILIEDLLAFSRVSTKAQPPQAVSLDRVVDDVVSDLEASITERGGKVDVGKLPVVEADPTHMRQLFQNLIGNALKFHKPDQSPLVKVSAKSRSGWSEIEVSDNGIGFDDKYTDRIFAVFQRLHGRDKYDGTGIGLAVCRKIVERYGGTITAKSRKGEGATFTVKLPIKK